VNQGFVGWSLTPAVPTQPYIRIEDQKASGTDGGTFTSGAWQTRVLNTIADDTYSLAVLNASNQIILPAGIWRCFISCPAIQVNYNAARLQNITLGTTITPGTSVYVDNSVGLAVVPSIIRKRFQLLTSTTLEVQHRCSVTKASSGFGIAVGAQIGGVAYELYTVAEFWKIS
jgi:hypothetical protein